MKILTLSILLFLGLWTTRSSDHLLEQNTAPFPPKYCDANRKCLKCHGNQIYQYKNEELGTVVKDNMCVDRMIDTIAFYQSNHSNFECTDCHSPDYEDFPHPGILRMELKYTCIDCHGDDPLYEKFHFEEIENAFYESMHYNRTKNTFSCWSCHNPHYYKTQARTNESILKTITYDNNICLSCHANVNRFKLMTQEDRSKIISTHDWLPNQALHFKNVRCIECHTQLNDSLLISHVVMPKENAIRKCTQCHSENSYLMETLYRYQTKEARQIKGFVNAAILNESYVIGANHSHTLNLLSLVLFCMVLTGIFIHIIIRIIKHT